jgi:hypothetical protein
MSVGRDDEFWRDMYREEMAALQRAKLLRQEAEAALRRAEAMHAESRRSNPRPAPQPKAPRPAPVHRADTFTITAPSRREAIRRLISL